MYLNTPSQLFSFNVLSHFVKINKHIRHFMTVTSTVTLLQSFSNKSSTIKPKFKQLNRYHQFMWQHEHEN